MIAKHPDAVDSIFKLDEVKNISSHSETDYGSKAWMEDH